VPAGGGGVEVEWRSLFRPRPVDEPTYQADLVGPLERFDERDSIFARMDLQPGSDRYEAYYGSHPELQAVDDLLRSLPPLGSTGAPADRALMDGLFGFAYVAGLRGPGGGVSAGGRRVGDAGGERVVLDPGEAAMRVKAVARYLGADMVGIGPLNQAFVYSHVGRAFYGQQWGAPIVLEHPYAISIGVAMDYELLRRFAPGFPVILESGLAYARAAAIAVEVASYLRGLGYSARAHHLRDYQLLCVPVAVDAGMGELGRSGVLLTREFGSAIRLATVTTDLPMAVDRPVDLGIQQFCRDCRLCAMACPAGAIPSGEKVAVRGVRRWKLAAGRCYHYWRQVGSDCALCLVACPWSKPDRDTRPLRPSHPEPVLDAATLAAVREARSTLPRWLQRFLSGSDS